MTKDEALRYLAASTIYCDTEFGLCGGDLSDPDDLAFNQRVMPEGDLHAILREAIELAKSTEGK